MLDKSIPYVDVIMHRKKGAPIPHTVLPHGFAFAHFRPGDEKAWARIETSVLEFPDELDALIYFQTNYLPYAAELERRCVFVETGDGEKVGTSTGWWNYTGARSDPWLHWVAVVPEYQELGLGSAIISKVTAMMNRAISSIYANCVLFTKVLNTSSYPQLFLKFKANSSRASLSLEYAQNILNSLTHTILLYLK